MNACHIPLWGFDMWGQVTEGAGIAAIGTFEGTEASRHISAEISLEDSTILVSEEGEKVDEKHDEHTSWDGKHRWPSGWQNVINDASVCSIRLGRWKFGSDGRNRLNTRCWFCRNSPWDNTVVCQSDMVSGPGRQKGCRPKKYRNKEFPLTEHDDENCLKEGEDSYA